MNGIELFNKCGKKSAFPILFLFSLTHPGAKAGYSLNFGSLHKQHWMIQTGQ
jgi:hypothetical protein